MKLTYKMGSMRRPILGKLGSRTLHLFEDDCPVSKVGSGRKPRSVSRVVVRTYKHPRSAYGQLSFGNDRSTCFTSIFKSVLIAAWLTGRRKGPSTCFRCVSDGNESNLVLL
jgi:hypothetical protein